VIVLIRCLTDLKMTSERPQNCIKIPQTDLKMTSKWLKWFKMTSKWPQNDLRNNLKRTSKGPQSDLKMTPEMTPEMTSEMTSKLPQRGSKWPQNDLKSTSKWPQIAAKTYDMLSFLGEILKYPPAEMTSTWPQNDLKITSKWPQNDLNMSSK
jgi:hypothetical protein